MPTYRVYLETTASLTIDVDIPDDVDPEEAGEQAIEKALAAAKRNHHDVCANCAGWRQSWSLDLGEWDVAREQDGNDIEPELRP